MGRSRRRPWARTTRLIASAAPRPRAMSQRTSPGDRAPGTPFTESRHRAEAVRRQADRLTQIEHRLAQPAHQHEDEERREDRGRQDARRGDEPARGPMPIPRSEPPQQLADHPADDAAGNEDGDRHGQRLADQVEHRRTAERGPEVALQQPRHEGDVLLPERLVEAGGFASPLERAPARRPGTAWPTSTAPRSA